MTICVQSTEKQWHYVKRGQAIKVDNMRVMGNLGKPLNFPLVWTRKGAVERRRSNWYCAARFACEKGNFAPLSQSTACRVVRSFWYLKPGTVNFGAHWLLATYLASWASPVSDYTVESLHVGIL